MFLYLRCVVWSGWVWSNHEFEIIASRPDPARGHDFLTGAHCPAIRPW